MQASQRLQRAAIAASAVGPARGAQKAVVIGGGIGGLATAARLAKKGMSVTILEQNAQTGGRCQSEEVDGYRWARQRPTTSAVTAYNNIKCSISDSKRALLLLICLSQKRCRPSAC